MQTSPPSAKPNHAYFGSGPSIKHPGWKLQNLNGAVIQRSHRSADAVARIQELLNMTRVLLDVPAEYKIAITPASDTGAMEMAMWSLLGKRGVDALIFDRFGELWAYDLRHELKLSDLRIFDAPCGEMPDLRFHDPSRDLVFCWNGTTTGVCVENADWIMDSRNGLTICDATSAAFGVLLPWHKLDVTTFSWQKLLGGEAAHGMIIMSPRAMDRLQSYRPPWPMPRIFRMIKDNQVNQEFFGGQTLNTPSLLCIEDCLLALRWIESIGGLPQFLARGRSNFDLIEKWVEKTQTFDFMARQPKYRSRISVCLTPKPSNRQNPAELCRFIANELARQGVAYDIMGHREAPPHIRIWAGGMVESGDIEKLLPWIEWAHWLYINRV